MSKKTVKKTTKPLSPKPAAKRANTDTGYSVEPEDLDEQPGRLRNTASAGAGAFNAPVQPTTAEQPPTAAAAKPLAPLAAVWPDPVPSNRESRPSQGPTQPARETPPAAVSATAAKPTAPKRISVTFALLEPNAKRVALCGEFNGWASNAAPMNRHQDGHWEMTVALAPGRYEYKFLVDGNWIPDPLAQENVWNYHGTLNSVIEVRA